MTIPVAAGVRTSFFQTDRIAIHALEAGPDDGVPVVFVHDDGAGATSWEAELLALPPGLRGVSIDLRGYGASEALPIDARLGLDDLVADVRAALRHLGVTRHHLVGHGLGGAVVWKYLLRFGPDVIRVVQQAPYSPWGFGGSVGDAGRPLHADGAGSGAGLVDDDVVRRLASEDRSGEPGSPLHRLRTRAVLPGTELPAEASLLESALATVVDDDHYPGDVRPSPTWPGFAPGDRGLVNAVSRRHYHAGTLHLIRRKPPVLWLRGADDPVVSDASIDDPAVRGAAGELAGWPGEAVHPPQPMLRQTRVALQRYEEAGGRVSEVVLAGCGHSPHLEQPARFRECVHPFLAGG